MMREDRLLDVDESKDTHGGRPGSARGERGWQRLVTAVKELSLARSMDDIAAVVRRTARALNGADGATFVLRDADRCHYFDEDAIAPLWKGLKFPLESCISGWAMINKTAAVIPDIYVDPRIPHDAYRPTFVKSLVMVPVRQEAPVAAIGNYWARPHIATADEVALIQALADSTSVAMENVRVLAELEARVEARTRELANANRELEAFASSVSHDLRTPLAQITGFAELIVDDLAAADLAAPRAHAHHVLHAARQMNGLITDLLALSQTTSAPLEMTEVDLGTLARDLAERHAGGNRVEWRIERDLHVVGDRNLLRVLLDNLLGNARKYSGKKPRALIELGAHARSTTPGHLHLYVRDNGAGFDPAQVARLFRPFHRLHADSDFPGTGIGLATCERIVQRHAGRIWAESTPGEGATFHFTLPAPPA